ncbi:SDR family oxidoreductase [Nocardia sp. SYP-A9097]|uniref:SDR family NAD(P)-dependent oxidoreductase n=1 Tax=Nocardia sp. SYP-A9097 TaxID=2663237 RepID=UPI00129A7BD4|nr:SDR family oxidoreductase [Nocardia sp. SYP-A9097]MRH91260.1 SDR family oxidoreductase [Nocardia sp. SYP-A9097]
MGLLDEKVVIITGAGGGIGLDTALHLHEEGARVVATVHSESGLAKLDVGSDRLVGRVVDVTSEEQIKALIEFTVERFGRLDGIVNNAGILIPGTILDATVEDYQLTFDVNVKGVFLGSKYAIPELLKAGGGSIVNFGSINSIGAEKLLTTYTASKGAVLTLTKAIALDFGAQGIRANTLCPGFVDTPLNVPHYTALGGREALESGLADFQPIGRAILPLEIAHSVAFLLSDHSTAITGTAFVVDGGVLAGA